VNEDLQRVERRIDSIELLVREDHDLLTKLINSDGRIDDHEARIRFLERIAFGLMAVLILLQFVVNKLIR
jgi:hypothetical protein